MKYPVVLFFCMFCYGTIHTQPDVSFELVDLGANFSSPVDIANAGDNSDRLFIVEKGGRIRIVENNTILSGYFLDISGSVITTSECGLLGLDFHPNYPTTPYIYVFYMRTGPVSRIARFTVNPSDPNDILENSEFTILDIGGHPSGQYNHKAGDLAFGPDGYLYIAVGDGGGGGDPDENGQDPTTLLGKLLRIAPNDTDTGTPYTNPPDNPGVGVSGYADEIWTMGLRNPWRFSFDQGNLWIADVGQGAREEVNFIPSGSAGGVNCGWDCFEGNAVYESPGCLSAPNYTFPIFDYPRNCNQGCPYGTGTCVIGGFVYRGNDYPAMQGYYICADRGSNNYWAISHNGSNTTVHLFDGDDLIDNINTFGVDEDNELYAAMGDGSLYRVIASGVLPVYLTHFEAHAQATSVLVRWRVENVSEITSFVVERSTRGTNFKPVVTISPEANKFSYAFTDHLPEASLNYYRLVYTLADGDAKISEMRTVDMRETERSSEVYTHIGGGLAIRVFSEIQDAQVSLYTADGRPLTSKNLTAAYSEIPGTANLLPGIYVVVIQNAELTQVHKWLKREY